MKRRDDWLERLWQTLEAAKGRPFFYGACVALAAEAVDAMTDSKYRPEVEPLISVARDRFISLEELSAFVRDRLGEPIALNLAHRGDVMLLDLGPEYGPALGICAGDRIACAGELGVVYLRRERAIYAWRVG